GLPRRRHGLRARPRQPLRRRAAAADPGRRQALLLRAADALAGEAGRAVRRAATALAAVRAVRQRVAVGGLADALVVARARLAEVHDIRDALEIVELHVAGLARHDHALGQRRADLALRELGAREATRAAAVARPAVLEA